MKLENIEFDGDLDSPSPINLTVTISIEEALWIAEVCGQQRGGGLEAHSLFCGLHNHVFNRFWDGGIDDAKKIYKVETPPINYEDEK